MARISIAVILFACSTSLAAADVDWYKDWWDNVYELRIKQQQIDDLSKDREEKCPEKLQRYRDKVQEEPNSEYYKFKLEEWQKKCFVR
jgi:transcription elongation factor Elf1